jgi:hypothetical protein
VAEEHERSDDEKDEEHGVNRDPAAQSHDQQ